jgi:N-acetylglutamate synthase-like GNAT family acetyltransferase
MTVRKGSASDIPAIVDLLKSSLGNISSTKSVAYWNWKHVNNPFGPSPVLVAEEDNQLIGVRAMMQWHWIEKGKVYKSLRAVDTATHPSYQGKGIFTKLTMQLINQAKEDEFDFIFNSPNSQSTPGYLKMGWVVWGKMPLWIKLIPGLSAFKPEKFEACCDFLQIADLNEIPINSFVSDSMQTVQTAGFLKWRYKDCPVKKYGLDKSEKNGNTLWLFFTVKSKNRFTELRICNFYFSGNFSLYQLSKQVSVLAAKLGCRVATVTGLGQFSLHRILFAGFIPAKRFSITLTIRELSDSELFHSLLNKKNWLMQTGDIELF